MLIRSLLFLKKNYKKSTNLLRVEIGPGKEDDDDEIITPFEQFDEYFTSPEVQDNRINEYDIDIDVLTAPVDDTIIEPPTFKQVITENSSFPTEIQERLKIFQQEC